MGNVRPLIVVTGTRREAALAAGDGVIVLAGGGDGTRLAAELARLAPSACGIISFGAGGGLILGQAIGDMVIGTGVLTTGAIVDPSSLPFRGGAGGGGSPDRTWPGARAPTPTPPLKGRGFNAACQILPLRGRWQPEGLTEGARLDATSARTRTPSVSLREPPPPEGEDLESVELCDPAWVTALSRALPLAQIGPVFADGTLLADPKQKHRAARSGAIVADMESHLAGAAAARYRLPFAILRCISDTADAALPPAVAVAMRPDGSLATAAILTSILRRPRQLPALIRTGREFARAFAALQSATQAVGPRLAFDQPALL